MNQAIITLKHDNLAKLLDLPTGTRVVGARLTNGCIEFLMQGDDLPFTKFEEINVMLPKVLSTAKIEYKTIKTAREAS